MHALEAAPCTTWSRRVAVRSAEGAQQAWVLATNVYLKTALGWRLVAHHASPGSASEPHEPVETPSTLH